MRVEIYFGVLIVGLLLTNSWLKSIATTIQSLKLDVRLIYDFIQNIIEHKDFTIDAQAKVVTALRKELKEEEEFNVEMGHLLTQYLTTKDDSHLQTIIELLSNKIENQSEDGE